MNNQLTDKVKFGQKTALIHQGKALILKRSMDSQTRPGEWDLPGGNTEWPTLTEPTANLHRAEVAREILEETGLKVNPDQFTDDALVLFYTFFEPNIQKYSIICGWRIELPTDFNPSSVILSHEHTEQAWIPLDQLDQYNFGEPVGTYVKNIIRNALQRK